MKFTTLCYIEKEDSYLMLHRVSKKQDANKDKWIGLGGKFEKGESPEDCLLREVKEESGLTLTKYRFRGIVTFISDEWEEEYMCIYTADRFEGEIGECNEGVLEWVKKKQITSLNLWEGDRIFLDLLADDKPFFSLKLVYEKEDLVNAVLDGKPLEFFDLRNEDGTKTGKVKPRSLVHQDGDLHGTSDVWIARNGTSGEKELLLQKRSKDKDAFPGCYDISSSGHLDVGEEYLEGAVRELKEELGVEVKPEDLQFVGMHKGRVEAEFYGRTFRDYELAAIYLYDLKEKEVEFVLQESEVDSVKWIPYKELKKQMKDKTITNCIFEDQLKQIGSFLQ